VTRVRNGLLLVLTAGSLAGCEIDRVEWESAGFPVEEVTRTLEEEHGAEDPAVRCIKREVGGAVWECHATAAEREFECEVKVGPREAIRKLECEAREPEAAHEAAA
jgi:hypothetical protein